MKGGGELRELLLAEMMIAPKRLYVMILNVLTFPKYQKQRI